MMQRLITLALAVALMGAVAAHDGQINCPASDICPETNNTEPFAIEPFGRCSSMAPVTCYAPWAFCIDAVCDEEPVINAAGVLVANCHCWPQPKSWSIGPGNANAGASCVAGTPYGDNLCESLNDGLMISTYSPLGSINPDGMVGAQCAPGIAPPWRGTGCGAD